MRSALSLALALLSLGCVESSKRPAAPNDRPPTQVELEGAALEILYGYPSEAAAPFTEWSGYGVVALGSPEVGDPETRLTIEYVAGWSEEIFGSLEGVYTYDETDGTFSATFALESASGIFRMDGTLRFEFETVTTDLLGEEFETVRTLHAEGGWTIELGPESAAAFVGGLSGYYESGSAHIVPVLADDDEEESTRPIAVVTFFDLKSGETRSLPVLAQSGRR